ISIRLRLVLCFASFRISNINYLSLKMKCLVLFRALESGCVSSNDNKELENSTLVQDAIKPVLSLIYAQPFGLGKESGFFGGNFLFGNHMSSGVVSYSFLIGLIKLRMPSVASILRIKALSALTLKLFAMLVMLGTSSLVIKLLLAKVSMETRMVYLVYNCLARGETFLRMFKPSALGLSSTA